MLSLRQRFRERWSRNEGAVSTNKNEFEQEESREIFSKTASEETRNVEELPSEQLHFIVDFIGSSTISEAKSVQILSETLKRVKKQQLRIMRVDFTITDGILKVSCVESSALLLTAPLYAIALCAQEQLRGFDNCFALNITRRKTHMCHVFEAGSRLEAASVVRSVAVAFKTIGRLLREKRDHEQRQKRSQSLTSSERTRTTSEASTVTSVQEALRTSQRRHVLYREKMDRESSTSSLRRSPIEKRLRSLSKSGTNPTFLRHGGVTHMSGRHMEFSPLSPVPSDSSDNEGNNGTKKDAQDIVIEAEVHITGLEMGHVSPEQVIPKEKSPLKTPTTPVQSQPLAIPSPSGQHILPSPPLTAQNIQELSPTLQQLSSPTLQQAQLSSPNFTNLQSPTQQKTPATPPSIQQALFKSPISQQGFLASPISQQGSSSSPFQAVTSSPMSQSELASSPPFQRAHASEMVPDFFDEDENFKPALKAVLSGNSSALEGYLNDGLSENASDSHQRSLLFHAVLNGKSGVAWVLLKRGAEVNWEGPEDKTPLHIAASDGNLSATKVLLKFGANVRAKDSAFCTPLHLSVGYMHNLEVSHLLVEHGARINDNNLQGVRPVDLEPQLKEMQRLHVQSACEAFTAVDLSKSRSSSNTSSYTNPTNRGKPATANHSPRLERIESMGKSPRWSSLCSIPRGGLAKGSPELSRNIKRSESFNLPQMFSPQLVKRKRPLRRSLSFQKCPMDHEFQEKLDARIESDLASTSATDHPTNELNLDTNKGIPPSTSLSNKDGGTDGMIGVGLQSEVQPPSQLPSSPQSAFIPIENNTASDKSSDGSLLSRLRPLSPAQGTSSPPSLTAAQASKGDNSVIMQTPERSTSPSQFGRKAKLKAVRQPSEDSEHSGACHRSVSEYEDSSYMSGGSHITHEEDPIIEALKSIVLLSGNPECHESLLAYLCLPRASSQLISLARMPSPLVAENVAVLIGNLFNLEGPESRKRSVEAGLIKTVLRLVDGAEPIQSTCLSILHNILDFDNDREYSTALQSIPLEPLLNLLHINDNDSVLDVRTTDSPPPYYPTRRRKTSSCSRGSHDDWGVVSGFVQRNNSEASDGRPVRLYHKRNSISSMASSAEGEQAWYSSSYGHGHLPWTAPDMHSKNLPRLVATKMLAATTMNAKMQRELGKDMPLSLILETLQDSNNDIVVHATAALANIGMNIQNHEQLQRSGVVDALLHLLNHIDPRVTYHAARGLIYLGYMEVNGIYLFKHIGDDKVDVIFADTTGSEHLYVKGATVEKIVEIATNNPSILWGGARLQPPSPKGPKHHHENKTNNTSNGSKKAADDQIVDFILTMYSSFVHPVILMRLLIHRFRDPWFDKYFDGDPTTGQIDQHAPLPIVHIHLMRIWKKWLDRYPQDFINHPTIASELSYLLLPMRRAGGPYQPCADSLETLLLALDSYTPGQQLKDDILQENHCHHSILYEQCQKAIVGGGQPCQLEDAVYLSALQLYIEDLLPIESRTRQWFFQGSASPDKLAVSRIKQSLPPSLHKVKNITKRIKAQREAFFGDGLSERNSKHNYVDFCQRIAGYGCRFFKLKECQSTVNKKVTHIPRLFGINPKKVFLLDEKTKAVVGIWQFKDIKRWNTSSDNTRLLVEFTKDTYEFLLENKNIIYKEITELLFSCTRANLETLGQRDFTPWSKYAEDTEKWGHIALVAELEHQIPDNGIAPNDDGPSHRSRAVSCVQANRGRPGRYPRHASLVDKLSTSAPFARASISTASNVGPEAAQTMNDRLALAPVLGATVSTMSPLSGVSFSSNQQSVASSEEFLIGSFQQALYSGVPRSSWNTPGTKPRLTRNISRESEGSEPSPTEHNPLDPSLSLQSDRISPSGPPTRHRYLSSDSANSSIGCPSPSFSREEPIPTLQGALYDGMSFDTENFNRMFGLSLHGQLLICRCPPDALLPGFNRRNFTAFELLQHPKELARQITIIDHEYFCAVTGNDIQTKIALGTGKKRQDEPRLLVERVADRFNQLSTWVVASILTEDSPEKRAIMFENFIETAKQCLEFRNFNAVMAIVVAALGSAPIRRLARTKELVPKEVIDLHAKFELLMDPKDNYKRYRTTLRASPTPAVPYFGVYMKDLTFIAEGNPDLLKGGLVNMSKRRQIYLVINEVRKFQKNSFNFQEVPEIREFLLSQKFVTEEDLHQISRQLEPTQDNTQNRTPRKNSRRYSEPGKDSRSFSIPSITRSNTIGQATGRKLAKSLSIEGDSTC